MTNNIPDKEFINLPNSENEQTFNIGLVSAGAISAGAYTGGVMDYLFEALKGWYEFKNKDSWKQPPHDIKIKVISGASAGGMCAALSAISICEGHSAKFKKSWVEDIDIDKLVLSDHIPDNFSDLLSFLNCEVLDTIAKNALSLDEDANNWYPFLDNSLDLVLTATNLNGIPYEIKMQGNTDGTCILVDHSDYFHFKLYKPELPLIEEKQKGIIQLQSGNDKTKGGWQDLQKAGLATGAFPLAMQSRKIRKDNNYLLAKIIEKNLTDVNGNTTQIRVKPLNSNPESRSYLYVDGGMTNNEPFEVTRSLLAGSFLSPNDRNGSTTTKAVVMIDPFPNNQKEFDFKELRQEVKFITGSLYTALRNQSKFKKEELLMASDENIFSRFLIAPKRLVEGKTERQINHLAGSIMGAFGGFLDRSFREHDYLLGRRNCQRFLSHVFVLPENNPLFKEWPPNLRAKHYVKDDKGNPIFNKDGIKFLPIIPLVDQLKTIEEMQPHWPQISKSRIQSVENKAAVLVDKLIKATINDFIPNKIKRWAANRIVSIFFKNKINNKLQAYLNEELKNAGLLK
jgi:predicted acylesterase/phospholipase RssA